MSDLFIFYKDCPDDKCAILRNYEHAWIEDNESPEDYMERNGWDGYNYIYAAATTKNTPLETYEIKRGKRV